MAKLDPRFTFENFVVGPANRLAAAAARRAAERPGVSYNPLLVYAAPGLGKTHILGAISRHVAKVYPDKEVEYQTAQEFLREFVRASGEKDREKIRNRHRALDILLIDDVQYLTAQADVQELLLLTLDTLTGDGKQVVLASDRPPAKIDGLGAHLRTRFEGGLLVSIGPPEYETRVAIVQKSIESRLQILGQGVADALGRFPFPTVTELLSALTRILEVQDLENRLVTAGEVPDVIQRRDPEEGNPDDLELGKFLGELSDTVAARVQAQEAPWRRTLRVTAEGIEAEDFRADRLRRLIDGENRPPDLDGVVEEFRGTVRRLKEIRKELDAVGNPWPEAAYGVLRDPERLEEAEALLASAKERSRPFPTIPQGPSLEELGGQVPQLVIRAADQLIRTDRPEYNPLYVWSPDGAAARILLHAAGRAKLKDQDRAKIALAPIHWFAEEFIRSLTMGVAGAWRERWWSSDLLLVDGAQDLSSTERAQEEFFHLFEALQRRRARVMIAADRPPSQISALDDRLRARLDGGLVIEIDVRAEDLSTELRSALEETPTRSAPPEVEERDIADEDREWIRSFRPGSPTGRRRYAGAGRTEDGQLLEDLGGGKPEAVAVEAWLPSPEKVVWDWPRLEDRIVEEAD